MDEEPLNAGRRDAQDRRHPIRRSSQEDADRLRPPGAEVAQRLAEGSRGLHAGVRRARGTGERSLCDELEGGRGRHGLRPDTSSPLKVARDSGRAFDAGTLAPDVRAEQEKLLWADTLVFPFPLWWYTMPAIL
ncbi:hypothetical protein GCM10010238_48850 [Streptomyces griseoviridis]|uniref:Flavodoxin-like fold domain-containing protein n=1 Tax=Streptomyces griseoviridis TaxID=45398 RepID=A0A918GQA8_STRGD|nr:hypothetical protein GCM10010238_48850 [Streptomyces niveoruber]